MATIFLARHGETIWHSENRYTGSSDIALTRRGLEQAEALGRWAAGANLTRLASSDLSRAVKTAEAAQRHTGLELIQHPGLREVDFGRGEGLTIAEMLAAFPEGLKAFLETPARTPLPQGEPGASALERVIAVLEHLASADDAARILVVMHSTVMRLVICRVLGVDIDSYRSIFTHVANCAVTELRTEPGKGTSTELFWRLAGFNVPPEI